MMLATGKLSLDEILCKIFGQHYAISDVKVDIRRYLLENVSQVRPDILIVHEKLLSGLEDPAEKDKELLFLLEQIKLKFPLIRIVVLCTRQDSDPFLQQLVNLSIFDIFWSNNFKWESLFHQLQQPPNLANVIQIKHRGREQEWREAELYHSNNPEKPTPGLYPPDPFKPQVEENVGNLEETVEPVSPAANGGRRESLFSKIRKQNQQAEAKESKRGFPITQAHPFQSVLSLPNQIKENVEAKVSRLSLRKEAPQHDRQEEKGNFLFPETILVFSPKGGVGKTTLTLALAALFERKGAKVGVIDLTYPHGHISSYLNIPPSNLAATITSGSHYYSEADWHQLTVEHKGIRYYLPPNQWEKGFTYTEELIDKLIRNMQRSASITLIDLGSQHDLASIMMAFSHSTRILWPLDQNKATIFHTRRQLNLLREEGFMDLGKIHFVLNRVATDDIDLDVIEDALDAPIEAEIPEDETVISAMNQGRILSSKTGDFEKELDEFMASILPLPREKRFKFLGR
jgi:MinD-like ATPase involved in chromosome partitioning or flagellar assembly